MFAHAILNELFNVFPILFRVKVCVGAGIKVIKHDNFQHMLRIGIRISSPRRFWYTSTAYDFMEDLLIT